MQAEMAAAHAADAHGVLARRRSVAWHQAEDDAEEARVAAGEMDEKLQAEQRAAEVVTRRCLAWRRAES